MANVHSRYWILPSDPTAGIDHANMCRPWYSLEYHGRNDQIRSMEIFHGDYLVIVHELPAETGKTYVLECMFFDAIARAVFKLPDWAEGAREVTKDPAWNQSDFANSRPLTIASP